MDTRLKEMEQAEVDLSVLSLNPPGVQIYDDTKKAVSLVQDMNDRLPEIVQSRSGRFGGLGSLAPQDPKRSADKVKTGRYRTRNSAKQPWSTQSSSRAFSTAAVPMRYSPS
jgi:predicted TIM-barrel fold metal-dependent hydrolase